MSEDLTGNVIAPELGQQVVSDLADLNEAFLAVLADARRRRADTAALLAVRPEHVDAIERLRAPARRRLTHCAFALFDLRLDDLRFWRSPRAGPALVRDGAAIIEQALEQRIALLTLCALMYARHVATVNRFLARLSFGASDEALAAISATDLGVLQRIVADHPGLLRCRLATDGDAWPNLLRIVRRGDGQPLVSARILGLRHAR